MAQNITIAGASYNAVPAIEVPKQGTGTAIFADPSGTTAVASDVATGKYFLNISGVLTLGTASGGGGQYAWLGSGAEKVGTVINQTINLKNDTTYDSWTASTTAGTIKAASATPDYSFSANMNDYDYCFVTKGFVEPVYVSGTPATYRTYRVAQYHVHYCYGYPNSSTIDQVRSDNVGSVAVINSSTVGTFIQYYYNNSGMLAAISATNCGPIYMSNSPSTSSGSVSSGTVTISITLPSFSAKCHSSRFSTTRKTQVDSANTNYYLTVDLYRVPHGNGLMSHWISEMCAALNET